MSNRKLISNQEAADFLINSDFRQLLRPFMEAEVSLSEAAEKLDMKLNTLHYHVKKMLELDLIKITQEEVRKGHMTKLYKSSADKFLVPLEASSSVDLMTHFEKGERRRSPIFAQGMVNGMLAQSSDWAFCTFFVPELGVGQAIMGKDAQGNYKPPYELPQPVVYYGGQSQLKLTKEAALELQKDLHQIYQKFLSLEHSEGQEYLLKVGLVPINPNT